MSAGHDDEQPTHRLQRDTWYKEPPGSKWLDRNGGEPISDERIFEVESRHESEAEQMLASTPIVAVDWPTAKRMVGHDIRSTDALTPFLVRGLFNSKGTGHWEVYQLGDKLQVSHFCLGNREMEMHRQPLILLLKSKPAEVYTVCGVVAQ